MWTFLKSDPHRESQKEAYDEAKEDFLLTSTKKEVLGRGFRNESLGL
jgi:hypothetical protein